MDTTSTPPRRPAVGFGWRLPLRVLQLARRVELTPWEALAWLETALADLDAQAELFDGVSGNGLPWPPDD